MIAQALDSGRKTKWTVIMVGGGHFAAAVFEGTHLKNIFLMCTIALHYSLRYISQMVNLSCTRLSILILYEQSKASLRVLARIIIMRKALVPVCESITKHRSFRYVLFVQP